MCIFSHNNSLEKRSVTGYCFMRDARDTFTLCEIHFILRRVECYSSEPAPMTYEQVLIALSPAEFQRSELPVPCS